MRKNHFKLSMGEVYPVAAGFARNFLFPERMASRATPEVLKEQEALRAERMKIEAEEKKQFEQAAAALSGVSIKFVKPTITTPEGKATTKLYGSLNRNEIAAELVKLGHTIDINNVALSTPFKATGNYEVPIKFPHDVSAVVKLEIAGEATENPIDVAEKEEKKEEAATEEPKEEG